MRCIVLAVVMLSATSATAQTLHNIPASNIFDTYDPRCNGSDPSIIFCDGFEDGKYIVAENVRGGPESDYWSRGVFYQPYPDQFGRNFAECNSTSVDPNRANFGAAGTPCTATMDWAINGNHGQDASHWMTAQPGNPAQPRAVGTWNYYIRFYFKETGVTSTRCPGGWPNCPPFAQNGPNGYKAVEVNHGNETGGIDGAVLGTVFVSGTGRATLSAGGSCVGGFDGQQNLGNNFDHRQHRDEWIYTEVHVNETNNGTLEIWADACGRDGLRCTGTPTLRARYTGVNLANVCGPAATGQKIRALWSNWWNSSMTGEIQFDEFVVRDGEVLNAPIGFLTPLSGGTPTPPPPTPTPLAPPVLLPIN